MSGEGDNKFPLCSKSEKTSTLKAFEEAKETIKVLTSEITKLGLDGNKTDTVFEIIDGLVLLMKKMNTQLLEDDNEMNDVQVLDLTTDFIRARLSEFKNRYRRQKQNELSERYVPPQELALGLRWDLKRDHSNLIAIPKLVQCKFQFVSILRTLSMLFQNKKFENLYMEQTANYATSDNVYDSFRSGSAFKENTLYSSHPESLQIQLSTDDVEICNPLGSKSTLHKICAFYMTIKNLPQKYLSKLENIYTVILCNTDDLKTEFTDINDVLRPIVREIQYLENEGIRTGSNRLIRGSLSSLSFDNLGANSCLGFVESFSTSAPFCRICECDAADAYTV